MERAAEEPEPQMTFAPTTRFAATDADAYESYIGRWTRLLAPVFVDFADLPPDCRLLDVGCGTGLATAAALATGRVGSARGIDLSPAFVAHARATVPGAWFDEGDALALPVESGSADAAISSLALDLIPDAAGAAREMCRATRPGGVVAACVWNLRGGMPALMLAFDTVAALDPGAEAARADACASPLMQAGGLARLWRDAGLTEIEERALTVPLSYADGADFLRSFTGGQGRLGAHLAALDGSRRATIESAILRAFRIGLPDGPRTFAATAWAVRGRVPG